MKSKLVIFLCALFTVVLFAELSEAKDIKRDAEAEPDPNFYYYYKRGMRWNPLRNSTSSLLNVLHYTPQDEIDKGIICLFVNKSDPKELFEALQEIE
ncbi:hypothetical protein Glove_91g10 [Diversispora epigaea]|uniref:Uncharacterized protein n=1 Tax=Diversispora epigaea TaxID=1348612 RepID=A0A397J668_9GLOM|nr:hypothetical protein Glove_91g10 [Diversispora epigaea]